jgi:hypothetical protein
LWKINDIVLDDTNTSAANSSVLSETNADGLDDDEAEAQIKQKKRKTSEKCKEKASKLERIQKELINDYDDEEESDEDELDEDDDYFKDDLVNYETLDEQQLMLSHLIEHSKERAIANEQKLGSTRAKSKPITNILQNINNFGNNNNNNNSTSSADGIYQSANSAFDSYSNRSSKLKYSDANSSDYYLINNELANNMSGYNLIDYQNQANEMENYQQASKAFGNSSYMYANGSYNLENDGNSLYSNNQNYNSSYVQVSNNDSENYHRAAYMNDVNNNEVQNQLGYSEKQTYLLTSLQNTANPTIDSYTFDAVCQQSETNELGYQNGGYASYGSSNAGQFLASSDYGGYYNGNSAHEYYSSGYTAGSGSGAYASGSLLNEASGSANSASILINDQNLNQSYYRNHQNY